MKIVWQLFITFFKIGAFTLGGGYAMLSMVEKAVVDKKQWIPADEFWDLIAIVQQRLCVRQSFDLHTRPCSRRRRPATTAR